MATQPRSVNHVVATKPPDKTDIEREKWGTKWSFILCCIGYAVGLGNVWRFPKLAYENGGLAFLIPYWCSAMLFGLPGLYFEYILGQHSQTCAPHAFRKMAPIFQGLGWTMCLLAIGIAVYYNVLIAWALLYILNVLKIPFNNNTYVWSLCGNAWNDNKTCISMFQNKGCKDKYNMSYAFQGQCLKTQEDFLIKAGLTSMANVTSASEEYFNDSITNFGSFNWKVFAALAVVWTVTCLAIMFGAKVMGYTAYITATVPYFIIAVIFFRGVTLDGAWEGINYYLFEPDWSKLKEPKVWADAVSQVCYSMSLGIAGLLNMASYNDRHHNCFRDALIVSFADAFMSIFGGVGVFSILGFMAKQSNRKVSEVVTEGIGLAFVAYPEATAMMPVGWVFALIFFVMLFLLGIGTQFGLVSVLSSAFSDSFPTIFGRRSKVFFTPLVCLICFLLGIIMCFGSGLYWLGLLDAFTGSVGIPLCASMGLLIVCYIYGIRNFITDIDELFGKPTTFMSRWVFGTRSPYFIITWMFCAPFIGMVVFGYQTSVLVTNIFNDKYKVPWWGYALGIVIIILQFTPFFALAAWNAFKMVLTQRKSWRELFRVQPDHPSYSRIRGAAHQEQKRSRKKVDIRQDEEFQEKSPQQDALEEKTCKDKENTTTEQEEKSQERLKPRPIPRTAKEEMIAQTKATVKKTDYPTFDDEIWSDWDSKDASDKKGQNTNIKEEEDSKKEASIIASLNDIANAKGPLDSA